VDRKGLVYIIAWSPSSCGVPTGTQRSDNWKGGPEGGRAKRIAKQAERGESKARNATFFSGASAHRNH